MSKTFSKCQDCQRMEYIVDGGTVCESCLRHTTQAKVLLSHADSEIETLRTQLAAARERVKERETDRCDVCGCELSYCGDMTIDGPSKDCKQCQLRDTIKQLTERAERAEKLQSDIATLLRNKNRPELELLIYDNDGENFGVRLLDRGQTGVGHCVQRRISFDLPFVIASFVEWLKTYAARKEVADGSA